MRLIGLAGNMGAGKDAAAALLSMIGYQRVAFADAIRVEAACAVDYRMVPPEAPDVIANLLRSISLEEINAKPTSDAARRILQWWGTDYRRVADPEYWVRAAMDTADRLLRVVLSDVRFANEVAAIRARGGVIWRISRSGLAANGIVGHESERAVQRIQPDREIENDGSLIDLAAALRSALQ